MAKDMIDLKRQFDYKNKSEAELEFAAKALYVLSDRFGSMAFDTGKHEYSRLLVLNILCAHYDEFIKEPFTSYAKYFPEPTDLLPLIYVFDIGNMHPIELMLERHMVYHEELRLGTPPEFLNMWDYNSIEPYSLFDYYDPYDKCACGMEGCGDEIIDIGNFRTPKEATKDALDRSV